MKPMSDEEVPHSLFDQEDNEIIKKYITKQVKDSNAPISDPSQFGEFMTKPSLALGSRYHLYIPKEISLANLTDEETRIVRAYIRVINRAIYLAEKGTVTEALPNEKAAEFIGWLNSTRGKGMAHEKLMVEQNIRIHKTEERIGESKAPIWGSFSRKK